MHPAEWVLSLGLRWRSVYLAIPLTWLCCVVIDGAASRL